MHQCEKWGGASKAPWVQTPLLNTIALRPVTAQSVRSAQNVRQREMSDKTARNVLRNLKCPTKRPDMSDEIAHSQQTMNQGNKISSERPGTIVRSCVSGYCW